MSEELLESLHADLAARFGLLPFNSRIGECGRANLGTASAILDQYRGTIKEFERTHNLALLRECSTLSSFFYECIQDTSALLGRKAVSQIAHEFSNHSRNFIRHNGTPQRSGLSASDRHQRACYFRLIEDRLEILSSAHHSTAKMEKDLEDRFKETKLPSTASISSNKNFKPEAEDLAQLLLLSNAYKFANQKLLYFAYEINNEIGGAPGLLRRHFALASKISDYLFEFQQTNFPIRSSASDFLNRKFEAFRMDFQTAVCDPLREKLTQESTAKITGLEVEIDDTQIIIFLKHEIQQRVLLRYINGKNSLEELDFIIGRISSQLANTDKTALERAWESAVTHMIGDGAIQAQRPSVSSVQNYGLPSSLRTEFLSKRFGQVLNEALRSECSAPNTNNVDHLLEICDELIKTDFETAQERLFGALFHVNSERTIKNQLLSFVRFSVCGMLATAVSQHVRKLDAGWSKEITTLLTKANKHSRSKRLEEAQEYWSLAALVYTLLFLSLPSTQANGLELSELLRKGKGLLVFELDRKYFCQAVYDYISEFMPATGWDKNLVKLIYLESGADENDLVRPENSLAFRKLAEAKLLFSNEDPTLTHI